MKSLGAVLVLAIAVPALAARAHRPPPASSRSPRDRPPVDTLAVHHDELPAGPGRPVDPVNLVFLNTDPRRSGRS